jgi:hypothetical protein
MTTRHSITSKIFQIDRKKSSPDKNKNGENAAMPADQSVF